MVVELFVKYRRGLTPDCIVGMQVRIMAREPARTNLDYYLEVFIEILTPSARTGPTKLLTPLANFSGKSTRRDER